MQEFCERGAWNSLQLDDEVCQLGPTRWLYYHESLVFADALLRFQELVDGADPELMHFDCILLSKLEAGPCYVIHGERLEIRLSQRYLNSLARIELCKCGRWSVSCENPQVQLQCQCL